MKKLIWLIKDFKRISFSAHSNWRDAIKTFSLTPGLSFTWDTQCTPMIENRKVVIGGYREFYIVLEWLWFSVIMTFEFDWTVENPKDFEWDNITPEKAQEIADEIDKELEKLNEKWKQ